MKAEHVNAFINATIEVIATMASLKVIPAEAYLKKEDVATGDVSSIVGLTGVPTGSFSISFDKESILKISSSLFQEEITEIESDVAEAAGELANMISGQARRVIEEKGDLCEGAIPTVAAGDGHTIMHITNGPKIAVPFTLDTANITLEVCFES
jgi:chemotaxis protein CheX